MWRVAERVPCHGSPSTLLPMPRMSRIHDFPPPIRPHLDLPRFLTTCCPDPFSLQINLLPSLCPISPSPSSPPPLPSQLQADQLQGLLALASRHHPDCTLQVRGVGRKRRGSASP